MSLTQLIRKHALKNAFDYGKATPGNVVGKVIAEAAEAKKDMKKTLSEINAVVSEVNKLSREAVEKELANYTFAEKKLEEKRFHLQDAVEGGVVTRFLPEPNGPAHIGHAKAAWLSKDAARQYGGKCFLRFDDTNPEKESAEYVEALREDLNWLGLEFDAESFSSDLMPEFYKYAEKLVASGDAYLCSCSKEEIAEKREKKKACACRAKPVEENRAEWQEFVGGGVGEGEAVLRLKADLNSENTVMRDPTLFRIIETLHYRQKDKYVAWPTYDFEVSIADSLTGVTHALRSKEYELRDELYYYIVEKCGLRKPVVYDFSRLNIRGTMLSKRFLKPLIEEKKVWGWDDPRLPTIKGLKRRGLSAQAIKLFVLSFGLSKVESEPSFSALLTENKKLLEPHAKHYFFVREPVELNINGTPDGVDCVFIEKSDVAAISEGELFRLKNGFNVELSSKKPLKGKYAGTDLREGKKIHWVKKGGALKATLVELGDLFVEGASSGEKVFNEKSLVRVKGVCQKACEGVKKSEVIQFERIGLAILDDVKKKEFILLGE